MIVSSQAAPPTSRQSQPSKLLLRTSVGAAAEERASRFFGSTRPGEYLHLLSAYNFGLRDARRGRDGAGACICELVILAPSSSRGPKRAAAPPAHFVLSCWLPIINHKW